MKVSRISSAPYSAKVVHLKRIKNPQSAVNSNIPGPRLQSPGSVNIFHSHHKSAASYKSYGSHLLRVRFFYMWMNKNIHSSIDF